MLRQRNRKAEPLRLYAGVDRATDISLAEMKTLHENFGCSAFAFYVDAPSEYHAWSPGNVETLMKNGFHALPIYVPKQGGHYNTPSVDAQEFLSELSRYKIKPFAKPRINVVIDIESHSFDNNPSGTIAYLAGICEPLRVGGYAPVVYGTVRTILACDDAGLKAGYWAAAPIMHHYDGRLRPNQLINTMNLKSMGRMGRMRGWQYAFEVPVSGTNSPFDLNVWRANLAKAN